MRQIWHPWTDWESYKAGFYDGKTALSQDQAKAAYADFLRSIPRFEAALERVLREWPMSCEHFLSNERINRVAWLGQAAMCIATGVPSIYRSGFGMLSTEERDAANEAARTALERWLNEREDSQVHQDVENEGIPGRHPGRSSIGADGSLFGPFVQGNLSGDPEERRAATVAWVHAEKVASLHGAQGDRDSRSK